MPSKEGQSMASGTVSPATGNARAIVSAAVVDVALVVVFAVIGRASHHEALSPTGIAETTWPFLAGLAAGWLVTFAWRAPRAPVRTGLGVWALTVVGGMLLRAASGQGVVVAFVIVASVVLALFLVGWRAVAALVGRRPRT
jgi:hypothetical protein